MAEDVTNSELARSLARVEAKLDRSLDDHEVRLRRLEKYMWWTMGMSAAGAITGIGSLIASSAAGN